MSRLHLARLAALLAGAVALAGCMGDPAEHRARPVAPAFRPAPGRIVRVLGAEGTGEGSLRLGTRTAVVSNERGEPVARARRLHNRIEVSDRRGQPILELRPATGAAEGTGQVATHTADLVGANNADLGQLVLTGDHLVLYGPGRSRLQRGEIIAQREHAGPVSAEVFGAPGTDLIMRVRAAGPRTWEVLDEGGAVRSTVIGRALDPMTIASLGLPSPLPGEEGAEAFRAGVVAFLAASRSGPRGAEHSGRPE